MEYKVGSLAALISGNKNISNGDETVFLPLKKKAIKKESKVEMLDKEQSKDKGSKKSRLKSPKKINKNRDAKKQNSIERKGKKRKGDTSEIDLADSDAEKPPPKKQKFSENEQNAASRIKNKINKETKNSSEYKDRTVFVGNIPIKTKKETIKKWFRKYGLIDSVRIRGIPVADPKTSKKVAALKKEFHPDRNSVYAFIRYKNAEDAKKAEAENGELLGDHHLRVHSCDSDEKPDESKAIFVGNLPFSTEDEELWQLFKSCGLISHVRIVRDGRTGMCKGFGYVNFKDADSVQLALELEKVMHKDRELRISPCDSSRAKKKKSGKKPKIRKVRSKGENQENGDDNSPKKIFKGAKVNSEKFSGSKFDENKKGKKPKIRKVRSKVENQENGDDNSPKKIFKGAKVNSEKFSGSKFDENKKKKKFNKAALKKKKLAKKLAVPKPTI